MQIIPSEVPPDRCETVHENPNLLRSPIIFNNFLTLDCKNAKHNENCPRIKCMACNLSVVNENKMNLKKNSQSARITHEARTRKEKLCLNLKLISVERKHGTGN